MKKWLVMLLALVMVLSMMALAGCGDDKKKDDKDEDGDGATVTTTTVETTTTTTAGGNTDKPVQDDPVVEDKGIVGTWKQELGDLREIFEMEADGDYMCYAYFEFTADGTMKMYTDGDEIEATMQALLDASGAELDETVEAVLDMLVMENVCQYTIDGNTLSVTMDGETSTSEFVIDGNKLTITEAGETQEFERV